MLRKQRKHHQTSACAWLPQSSSSSQCFVFSNQQKLLDSGILLYSLSISIFNGAHTHVGLGASLEEVFQPTVLPLPPQDRTPLFPPGDSSRGH